MDNWSVELEKWASERGIEWIIGRLITRVRVKTEDEELNCLFEFESIGSAQGITPKSSGIFGSSSLQASTIPTLT
jgi:hypothetical protein